MELKDLAPLLLKKERANGDIDPAVLTTVLRDGAVANDRRKQLVAMVERHPVLSDRDMMFRNHTQRYTFGLKKVAHFVQFLKDQQIADRDEQGVVYGALGEPLCIDVHNSMFVPTLENQGDDEQRAKWLPLAKSYKILGAYAQTELGHGSNVQGIETVATYDKASQEFVIDSPTLTSRKWWPGGLGKTANHAIVHARLFLDGKNVGVQAFLVQLRSLENHQPLPGIEVGDIGPKVGFNAIDNGYCAFHKVRVPRENMMMRYAKVLPDGTFVKPKSDKLVYLTMVDVRANLVENFALTMAKAAAITTRFSAARIQGRTPDNKGEFQVLDYQNQQHKLFPFIAISYAAKFAARDMMARHDEAVEIVKSGDAGFGAKLAALHAVSSGLKAWLAQTVSDGVESCRRLCGGHGFTQSSNLAHLFNEIVGANTFEGTFDVLVQQHARYLLKALAGAKTLDNSEPATRFLSKVKLLVDPKLRFSGITPEAFGDLNLLVEAFEVRTARILIALAGQMKATNNNGNTCMVLMSRVSTAHAELMLLEALANGVGAIPAGPEKRAVVKLCSLFGAWLITKSLGDFRQHDYLSSSQADLAREQVVRLLPSIRKNSVLLTDAWDFSDFELGSTIGRYDGDIYRALVKRAADEPLNKTQVPDGYEKYLKPLIQSDL
ncbi:acyl-CoA dehydrogenase/oxidase [Phytophthora cinnamomi]|uniref:acyl-CoA dehydrogenase/oxidase n=1 Tax=Phytophthora cinnamomi TaxID=4785 RepID=UPI00355A218F|nr:acyl-CoA dehydrogenase/oxidase [Phytophthora cinnamomi]